MLVKLGQLDTNIIPTNCEYFLSKSQNSSGNEFTRSDFDRIMKILKDQYLLYKLSNQNELMVHYGQLEIKGYQT